MCLLNLWIKRIDLLVQLYICCFIFLENIQKAKDDKKAKLEQEEKYRKEKEAAEVQRLIEEQSKQAEAEKIKEEGEHLLKSRTATNYRLTTFQENCWLTLSGTAGSKDGGPAS